MTNGAFFHLKFEELRRRAEEILKTRDRSINHTEADLIDLIYELEVHHVELQIQNDELRKVRSDLEESRQAFSDLFESAPVGYLVVGENLTITGANRTACELLRVPKEQFVGVSFSKFIHPMDRDDFSDFIKQIGAEEKHTTTAELRLLRSLIVPFHARIYLSLAFNSDGEFSGWRITFSDITDLKRAEEELRSYAQRLESSNRELQDFAFIASHDLQEPLRKIQAFGDQLKKKYSSELGADGLDHLERICGASKRLQEMVRGLLDYSRVTTKGGRFTLVDLGAVVRGVLADLEWQTKRLHASVEVGDLPEIEADAGQMRQMFQNLISNALKFHADRPVKIKIQGSRKRDSKRSAEYVQIIVEDNGIGFEQQYGERIFNLFDRLHGRSAYEGTGIGLAVCRRIAERHGGNITAEGRPGEGATFIVTLPAEQEIGPEPAYERSRTHSQ